MSNDAVTRASVEDKLARYLLNADHPLGREKAKFFAGALGFTRTNAAELARQLVFDPAVAVPLGSTEFGEKYRQTIRVTGRQDRSILLRTVWIKNLDGFVRLVTVVPEG